MDRPLARLRPASRVQSLEELAAAPAWAWTFLAIRFFGLVVVVPVIEEFFLRGFLMRLVVDQDWWKVPFGKVNAAAVAVSIIVPMLWHQPGEFLSAAAWFGLVTWLMVRTRNPWDCVLAHATTNLLLGIYVVCWGEWAYGRKTNSKSEWSWPRMEHGWNTDFQNIRSLFNLCSIRGPLFGYEYRILLRFRPYRVSDAVGWLSWTGRLPS